MQADKARYRSSHAQSNRAASHTAVIKHPPEKPPPLKPIVAPTSGHDPRKGRAHCQKKKKKTGVTRPTACSGSQTQRNDRRPPARGAQRRLGCRSPPRSCPSWQLWPPRPGPNGSTALRVWSQRAGPKSRPPEKTHATLFAAPRAVFAPITARHLHVPAHDRGARNTHAVRGS